MAMNRREWTKSSYSGIEGCVEVLALDDGSVALRHSRRPKEDCCVFEPKEWAAFLAGVRSGEFDLSE